MESEFLLNISESTWQCGGFRSVEAIQRGEAAADRLQKKCRERRPLVSLVIRNPRHPLNKARKAGDVIVDVQITDLQDQLILPKEAV